MTGLFSSTIIPTIGRATLKRAVQSILDQELSEADFEVIVVNDSGQPLPFDDWQSSPRVQVIETRQRERIMARNSGAALARGKYLHFLDDDDWLAPGALQNFYELARETTASWLYGSSQLMDRQGSPLIQLHHGMEGNCFTQVMAGEWIPLQSSLIEAGAFFSSGGFNTRLLASEDIDLCRRIALQGDFRYTPALVAYIGMGHETSSSHYSLAAGYGRWAREQILNEPGVCSRLRDSAKSADWKGRVIRIYLSSAAWNLQQHNIFAAAERASYCIIGLIWTGKHILSPTFWQAIRRSYQSQTFRRGFIEANLPVQDENTLFKLTE